MKGLFTILVMLILISGMISPVYAPTPETLYGVEGNGSSGTPGGLNIVDQTDGSLTLVGDVVSPGGLSGLAIDSTVTAFGTTVQGSAASNLVIINLDTGSLVSTVGTVTDVSGQELKIGDLTIQPGTDVLYGITANGGPAGSPAGGFLFTIDKGAAIATLKGDTGIGTNLGLAFTPDGKLYGADKSGILHELDPSTGSVQNSIPFTGNIPNDDFFDGLGARSDGILFGSESGFSGPPFAIVTIDPTTGVVDIVGEINDEPISDLDFVPTLPQVVGGEYFTLDTTALLLAGAYTTASWMIPVLVSAAGFGLLFTLRKNH